VVTISLTTDFGTRDWFVGTMKGVIAGLNPRANIVDVTHEIPSGDIRAAAFALRASYHYFPKRTVHVAIVDPGVGSNRRAIAVRTSEYVFVGPDNGVLSWALGNETIKEIRSLENSKYFLQPISRTFHGRDIFAPVAAHLSRGVPPKNFGPALTQFLRLPWPNPRIRDDRIEGQVIYVDRFGNAITNIESASIRESSTPSACIFLGGRRFCRVGSFYQTVPQGKPIAVIGSSGFLEISVNSGNAAQELRLEVGTAVTLRYQ